MPKKIIRKIAVMILLPAAGFLLLQFAFWGGAFYEYEHLSTYNSNAKLVFTNTAAYLTKFETAGGKPSDMDGVYLGSLQWEKGTEYEMPFTAEGTAENFDYALKVLMGSQNAEWAGYYFVIIKDGIPQQSCWSKSNELLYRGERLARRAKTHTLGRDIYNGGERIGNYPDEMTGIVRTPPEWFEETGSDRLRAAKRNITENFPIYAVLLAPLVIYLFVKAVRRQIKRLESRKNPLWKGSE